MTSAVGYAPTPENRHYTYQFLDTAIAFLVLTIVFCSLRLTSRVLHASARWGLDDVFIVLAGFSSAATYIASILSAHYLLAYLSTADQTTPSALDAASKFFLTIWIVQLMLPLSLTFPKLSVLALYTRVFPTRLIRTLSWIVFAFVAATGTAYFFACLFLCVPVNAFWTGSDTAHCINEEALHQAMSGPLIAADLSIFLLPLRAVWALHLSVPKRLGILATFLTGSFGLAAGCVRWGLWFSNEILASSLRGPLLLDTWSIVEGGVYLIAACMPTLAPLVQMVKQGLVERLSSQASSRRPLRDRGEQPNSRLTRFESSETAPYRSRENIEQVEK